MLIQSHKLIPDPIPFIAIPTTNYSTIKTIASHKHLVIHYTTGKNPEGTINWFQNPTAGVSAHLLIARDGRIWQFVPFNRPAYHAGDAAINHSSIGIELDNIGFERDGFPLEEGQFIQAAGKDGVIRKWELYPDAQYKALVAAAKVLIATYGITSIIGHEDIVTYKLDPGPAFPMEDFRRAVLPAIPPPVTALYTNPVYQPNVRDAASGTAKLLGILYKGSVVKIDNPIPTNGYLFYSELVSGSGPKSGWVYAQYMVKQ